ncbi:MAG: hypothetical protein QQW96_24180 [Tychonema bourrellyi B0820]|uniref:hypothetical protein n=1 Tax=Tychonema bourrellyi TaxID=54313 RepID=UPI0015D502BA|nr:hypothetical protein [Tychonema bourrellyi]MDQ2100730.1 hypothetical protein [Tychonema bourrellyi B0820]
MACLNKSYRFLTFPTPSTDSRTWGEPIYSTEPTPDTVASNHSPESPSAGNQYQPFMRFIQPLRSIHAVR